MNLEIQIRELAHRACTAAERVGELGTSDKNAWLLHAADLLEKAKSDIRDANARDLRDAAHKGVSESLVNRLELSAGRWNDMIAGVRDIAALPDPVGSIESTAVRPNGLRVGRMRIPLGVICMVYESRPNVTVDAAALCVKAGNAVILRGGSVAIHSNLALAEVMRAAARDTGIPEDAISIVPVTDRAAIDHLLVLDEFIDLVIPRGGAGLIAKVTEVSRIPIIKHDAGVCHVYLDASAEVDMATGIVLDSKIRQMAVCNGLETLLVHRDAASGILADVLGALHKEGVEIRGDAETCRIFDPAVAASEADWSEEFLAPILAVKIVDDLDEAVAHIRRYGSDHTEIIVTEHYGHSEEFVRRVNSSTVGVNCSTGFSDGFQLGLGAEIGISTSKLHAYGPMGLEGLTTRKFVLHGDGQLRE